MNEYALKMMSDDALKRFYNSALFQAEKALDKGLVRIYEGAMTRVLDAESELKRRNAEAS